MKKILFGLMLSFASFVLVMSIVLVAAVPEKTDGFVCPVFNSDAVGVHNPNAVEIGEGDYTVIESNVNVPIHATNGDGSGTPPGPHSSPGDTDYTAIWAL